MRSFLVFDLFSSFRYIFIPPDSSLPRRPQVETYGKSVAKLDRTVSSCSTGLLGTEKQGVEYPLKIGRRRLADEKTGSRQKMSNLGNVVQVAVSCTQYLMKSPFFGRNHLKLQKQKRIGRPCLYCHVIMQHSRWIYVRLSSNCYEIMLISWTTCWQTASSEQQCVDPATVLGSIHPIIDTENCMKTTSKLKTLLHYELQMYVKFCILLYMYGISWDVRINNVI